MKIVLYLLFLCLIVPSVLGQLKLQFVQNADARGAVCNDGSPAAYYFTPGSGSGANVWVIHQEGGWWCWDNTTCSQRALYAPSLVSSKSYPPSAVIGGIFSNDPSSNPSFYNANLIYIKYCSSDAWSGTHIGTGDFSELSGWHFRGKFIIASIVQDLLTMGMNSSQAEILLTGCSAGGNIYKTDGVFVNADFVRELLPIAPAKYLAFSDAGWISNYDITEAPFYQQYLEGYTLWQGVVNSLCTYANQFNSYLCYFGAIVQPYIETPVITHIEQFDIAQFEIDCTCSYNISNAQMNTWMENLRLSIFASILTVRPPNAVFSPACAHHCSSLDTSFNAITVNNVSLQQFLTNFWEQGYGTQNAIDECTSLNCSGGCV